MPDSRYRLAATCSSALPRSSRGSARSSATSKRASARLEEAAAAGCELARPAGVRASPATCSTAPTRRRPTPQEIPGPSTEALAAACAPARHARRLRAARARRRRRSATPRSSSGPTASSARYRKTHLPFLGVDRFVVAGRRARRRSTRRSAGSGSRSATTSASRRLTRTLALAGADIVAHPTNWPVAAQARTPTSSRVARAAENRIFLLTANRVGHERGAEFCGWSQIVDPLGGRLAEAGETERGASLVAEIDLEQAREKDIVPIPGEYEMYLFGDRRPELYGALVEEHATDQPSEGGRDGSDG